MEPIEFAKGHGTGNDFVIIPDPEHQLILTPELVAGLCDRRFGIGGDGLLRVVRAAADPELAAYAGSAEWFMDYRNADGSVAEMCGNGVRVFARYLVESELVASRGERGPSEARTAVHPSGVRGERGPSEARTAVHPSGVRGERGPSEARTAVHPSGTREFLVGTRSGPVTAVVSPEAVSVTLGRPRLVGPATAQVAGRELAGTVVDTGNPHLVCPLPPDLELADLELTGAPRVDPQRFPDGVNVELIASAPGELEPDVHHLRMRVYERGVGETQSCGSGAGAAAAVALARVGQASGLVQVDVPGGRLVVSLTGEDCALTGPAVLVAKGWVALDALP